MQTERIVFVENILRTPAWRDRRFVMELIAPAIMDASGMTLSPLIDTVVAPHLVEAFRRLAPGAWEQHYYQLPPAAEAWLEAHTGPVSLAVGYEMPVWMQVFLDKRGIPWVDIRLSPLRFSLDLMFAVRSSQVPVNRWLQATQIPEQRIRLYATQMQASSRRYLGLQAVPPPLPDGALVFVGQTASDASLVAPPGRLLTVRDYAASLSQMSKDRDTVFYHAHPFAGEHAAEETRALADITGKMIRMTGIPTDQLLLVGPDTQLTGISSGLLQEATWFGVSASPLYRPVCPLQGAEAYCQYYVNDLMMPAFWRNIIKPGGGSFVVSEGQPDRLRHLHALWFSYGDYSLERGPAAGIARELRGMAAQLESLESVRAKVAGSLIFRCLCATRRRFIAPLRWWQSYRVAHGGDVNGKNNKITGGTGGR